MTPDDYATPLHLVRGHIYQPPDEPLLLTDELPPERVSDWRPFLLWLAAAAIAGATLWMMLP